MLGIPGEVRVAPEIGDSDRLAVAKQDAKHPMESRQVADEASQALADADGDEPVEAAVAVWDAKGSVTRAHKLACGAEDALEDALQVEVAGQREGRLVEGLHLFGAVAPALLGIGLGWARHVMAGTRSYRWPVEPWPMRRIKSRWVAAAVPVSELVPPRVHDRRRVGVVDGEELDLDPWAAGLVRRQRVCRFESRSLEDFAISSTALSNASALA